MTMDNDSRVIRMLDEQIATLKKRLQFENDEIVYLQTVMRQVAKEIRFEARHWSDEEGADFVRRLAQPLEAALDLRALVEHPRPDLSRLHALADRWTSDEMRDTHPYTFSAYERCARDLRDALAEIEGKP